MNEGSIIQTPINAIEEISSINQTNEQSNE